MNVTLNLVYYGFGGIRKTATVVMMSAAIGQKKRARDLRGRQAAHSKKRHTEASQCPQLGFKGFKIQISINFTMRPSHDEGKIHLQKTLCNWSGITEVENWRPWPQRG